MSDLPIPTPNGFDTMLALRNPDWADFLPEGVEVTILGERGAVIDQSKVDLTSGQLMRASIVLRLLMLTSVRLGGCPDPRMAWFTITRDPDVVVRIGNAHDCANCREGTDQALATLREFPEEPLVVGVMAY